ncbi:phasin family protein [Luteimonas yindakuii]|nr:phasin family protein [Luteimonas yindakuii]
MATYKKPDGTHTSSPPPPPPETSFPRALGESAQQIWLAGLGALGRAQEEGGRLFETLVREGREVDNSAREHLDAHTSGLRDGVESTVDGAREQVTAGWERVERLFDSGLQRTLTRLGVPTRRDVAELNARVEALTAELRKRDAAARRAKASATAGTPDGAARAPGPRRSHSTATGAAGSTTTPGGTAPSTVAPGAASTPSSTPGTGSGGATSSTGAASTAPLPSTSTGPDTGA